MILIALTVNNVKILGQRCKQINTVNEAHERLQVSTGQWQWEEVLKG